MKIFNRNALKIIALLSMTIDHIAKVFFDGNMIMVAIGRIAMPIFAFFIAEGFYYTRSKKKFILRLLLFAIISQIPYVLLFDNFIKHRLGTEPDPEVKELFLSLMSEGLYEAD